MQVRWTECSFNKRAVCLLCREGVRTCKYVSPRGDLFASACLGSHRRDMRDLCIAGMRVSSIRWLPPLSIPRRLLRDAPSTPLTEGMERW